MVVSKTAKRYASALLSLSVDLKSVETVLKDITEIKTAVEASRELLLFLRSPVIRRDRKRAVLKTMFESRLSPLAMAFLDQVCKKGREADLPLICTSFQQQYDVWAGIERVTVTSAFSLDAREIEALKAAMKTIVNRTIILNQEIDPDLIGGVKLKISDTVYDGSVKAQLNHISAVLSNNVA